MKNFLLIPILMVCMSGFAQPTISSFSPTSAAVGATITITGTNFSSVATDNIVFFGGVKAVVNAATASTLTVNVPVGAGYQSISVTTNRLTAYSKAPFTVTFPGVGTPVTTASFTATDVQLTKPSAVVFADIDGDGKPDMIITNKLDSTVAVYRNKSTGGGVSFETKADFKLGVIPRFIIAGDVNGDGKQDIISMNINNALTEDASFTVLINKSVPGQVLMDLQKKNISRGTFPGLSFGDFDLDGKPDIAVASMDSSQLVIYGNSSIADTVRFNTEKKIALPFPPEYMINADLDGDGKTDLLFSRSGDSSLYVSKNISTPGNFSFEYPNPVGAASLSQSYNPFVIADFNGDAKPDVAVVHNLSGKVSIFKNTSTGTTISFTGKVDIAVGSKPLMLAAADLNGDGLIDLIVNNAASATMSVLRNTSSGGFTTFDTKVDFPVSTSGNTTDAIAAIADLDMNGAYDFVGYNASLNGFLVYQNRMLTSAQSPHIYSFTPAQGKQGDTITINGHTLTAVNAVRFGGVAAASFKVVSDSIVSAVIGNGKSGAVSVTATTGTDSLAGFIFTSSVSPKINSFTPSSGTNGDTISIKGLRFTGTTQVRFGNFAPPFTVISDSLVKVVLGGGGSGSVKLTTPAGTDSLAGFVFISSVPKINSFTPTSGTNGDTISIKGVKFTGTTSVYFGGVTAKTFTVISDSLVKAVVGTGGSGNVYLQNNAGTDSASGFVYTQPTGIPKITSYSPLTGTSGTKITIIGKNLYSVASISFGNTPAASFTVNNDTSISATVGGGASGFVKISGSTGKDSLNGFVYTAPIQPVKVNSFTPSSGGTGTVISIRGLKFTGTTSVSFGGTAAASFTVVSDSTINATVGSGASGFVIVRTPNGSDSLNGFVYTTTPTQPVKVNSFTPSNGGTGTVVSIKGLKFTGATSVSFGGTAAASFTVVSDSTINATVGSGASGFVIVRTPNGSDSLNGFVYTAPTQPVKVNSF
ncbi:MAG: IPT/TIG domain-containing protein, partial [Bacteroidota bacterium]